MFRVSPEYFARCNADLENNRLKTDSVSSIQSDLSISSNSSLGKNRGSLCGFEKRFHGLAYNIGLIPGWNDDGDARRSNRGSRLRSPQSADAPEAPVQETEIQPNHEAQSAGYGEHQASIVRPRGPTDLVSTGARGIGRRDSNIHPAFSAATTKYAI